MMIEKLRLADLKPAEYTPERISSPATRSMKS